MIDLDKENIKNHANRNITYLLDKLGISYSDRGGILQGPCPANQHGGDRNNHTAFSWKIDIGRWICWSHHCEEKFGSDIIALVSSVLDLNFIESLKWINQALLDKDIDITTKVSSILPQPAHIHIHEPQKEDMIKFLKSDLTYLTNRGFDANVLIDYQVGLWQRPGTFMHDRIVFPIRDHEGFLVGFTGRTIHSEEFFKERLLDYRKWIHGRYLNKSTDRGELLTGSILFNLYRSKLLLRDQKRLILVEGPLDGMKLSMAGINNWVATLGTSLCAPHRMLLIKYGVTDLYVAYDNDDPSKYINSQNPGEKGWQRIERVAGNFFNLHKVNLPAGKDCGDLSISELQGIFNAKT